MKNTILTFIVVLTTFASFGQTKIDELITITFPCKIEKKETHQNNIKVLHYAGADQEDNYTVQRIAIDSIKIDYSNLPSDFESLKEYYDGVRKGFNEGLTKAGYQLKESKYFEIDGYHGLQTSYTTTENQSKVMECRFLLLNEYLYSIAYVNTSQFSELKKNNFMNSIVINKVKKPRQFIGTSTAEKLGYAFGQLTVYGVFILGIVFLIKYIRKKTSNKPI